MRVREREGRKEIQKGGKIRMEGRVLGETTEVRSEGRREGGCRKETKEVKWQGGRERGGGGRGEREGVSVGATHHRNFTPLG